MSVQDKLESVGRKKRWHEVMGTPFPKGTFERMRAVRMKGESKTDLVRKAVEKELEHRERLLKRRKK
jgi:hypothetical protein